MNLKDVMFRVSGRLGDPQMSNIPPKLLINNINAAITSVVSQDKGGFFSEETGALVADQYRYALPSYVMQVMGAYVDGLALMPADVRSIYENIMDTEDIITGKPSTYAVERQGVDGLILYLYPCPSDAYSLRLLLKSEVEELTETDLNTEINLPRTLLEAITDRATELMFKDSGNLQAALQWGQLADKNMIESRGSLRNSLKGQKFGS